MNSSRLGAQVQPVKVNLADHESIHQFISTIQASGRPVDAITLNAGVGVSGPFAETDLHKELDMVSVNVLSVLHVAKYIVKEMVARRSGRILIISSIAGADDTKLGARLRPEPLRESNRPGFPDWASSP